MNPADSRGPRVVFLLIHCAPGDVPHVALAANVRQFFAPYHGVLLPHCPMSIRVKKSTRNLHSIERYVMLLTLGRTRIRHFGSRFVMEAVNQNVDSRPSSRWTAVSFPSTLEVALVGLGERELQRRTRACTSLDALLVEVRAMRDEIVALGAM